MFGYTLPEWLLFYVVSCIGAMLLELFTGIIMEWLFKIKYWDYSKQKIQYKGHICLSSTLVWGLFGLLVNRVLHEPIEGLYLECRNRLREALLLRWLCGLDFVQSVREAWSMRKLLIHMEQVRQDVLNGRHAMESYLQELLGILYNIQAELTARYEVHLSIFKKI